MTTRAPALRDLPIAAGTGWPWSLDGVAPTTRDKPSVWPRITIVTPSYNQGRFIEQTIRSVLLQGYPNLEYMIIDGGSTDKTVEIIKRYDPWLAYWVSEKDRGQCHAINKGFARATGEIFAWLCSDDVYAPGALHKVGEAIEDQVRTVVIGDAVITNGPETLAGTFDRRRPAFEDMAYDVKTLAQPSVFWTRDLWERVGPLREDLYFSMDYDLWLRMLPAAASVHYVDHVLSYQRTQPRQKTRRDHPLFKKSHEQRADAAYLAARSRGETGLGWLARVWARKLRKLGFRFWSLRGPGFHWQALRRVCQGGRPSSTGEGKGHAHGALTGDRKS